MADDANPRIFEGANHPPADPTPFDAIKVHLEDLLTEARNWADGTLVDSAEQDAEVDKLIGMLRDGAGAADDARTEEKRPLDEQIEEIQGRYNAYIAPLKNKKPGKVFLAIEALKAACAPWRQKEATRKEAEAAAARAAAQAKADEAAAALRAANAADLEAREKAEALVQAAARETRAAASATKAASTGTGLRSYWHPEVTDTRELCRHYWTTRPEAMEAAALALARTDVLNGARSVPGCRVVEERRAI